jgi:hypothetical protein
MDFSEQIIKIKPLSEDKLVRLDRFNDIAKAIFILLLAISSNFVTTTFNCDLQKEFRSNPFVIHSFVLGIIFFSINILGGSTNNQDVVTLIYNSIYIYFIYLLLTKQSPALFLISIILIITIFLISTYEKHVKNTSIDFFNITNYYLEITMMSILAYGFYNSVTLEYNNKGSDFNFLSYMFRISKCT